MSEWHGRMVIVLRWALRLLLLLVLSVFANFVASRLGARADAIEVYRHGSSSSSLRSEEPLMVGAYNIAHGRGGALGASNRRADSEAGLIAHLKEIGYEIQRQKLDIVVLNEVDFASSWSWRVNQAQVIAEAAGLPFVLELRSYDCSLLFYKWEFGNAVLSRYPISNAELIEYPAFKAHEGLLFGKKEGSACTIVTEDFDLRVVAVHLEVRDEATRAESMKILHGLVAARPGQSFLIMGDFNSTSVFAASERLRSAGGIGNTFPSSAPDRRIDWIFGSPGVQFAEETTFGGNLSDHLGVKVSALSAIED